MPDPPGALLLAHTQFACTVSFQLLFPAITIGLAGWLAVVAWLLAAMCRGWRWARCCRAGHAAAPFVPTLGIFALCIVGQGLSVYPDVAPGAVTIWAAATDRSSRVFKPGGMARVLPMILACSGWAHREFGGKVALTEARPLTGMARHGAVARPSAAAAAGQAPVVEPALWATSIGVLLAVALVGVGRMSARALRVDQARAESNG